MDFRFLSTLCHCANLRNPTSVKLELFIRSELTENGLQLPNDLLWRRFHKTTCLVVDFPTLLLKIKSTIMYRDYYAGELIIVCFGATVSHNLCCLSLYLYGVCWEAMCLCTRFELSNAAQPVREEKRFYR